MQMKRMCLSIKAVVLAVGMSSLATVPISGQRVLTLDSCRSLAVQNNRTLAQSRLKKEMATHTKKAAGTNYLPKISLTAGYVLSGKEISILSDDQKNALRNGGTIVSNSLAEKMQEVVTRFPDLARLLPAFSEPLQQAAAGLNQLGSGVADAFRTDTRNMAMGALLLKQPLYMGGKIRAYDKITRYSENLADLQISADEQETILEVDQAYWQVVSLAHRKRLADKYLATLQKLDADVQKLVGEGFATRSDELQVAVRLNEAEMLQTKVDDGLVLSRMLLCQLCGLPLDSEFSLKEEAQDDIASSIPAAEPDGVEKAYAHRPEIAMLETANNIYGEKVKLVRSDFLPHLSLVGGYAMTYPSVYNSFEKKFRGDWHVGLLLQVPIWNWGEGRHKVRAAEAEARMNQERLYEAREKIELQVTQSRFRLTEAQRKLALAQKSLSKADENVRIATLGYQEGVIPLSDVLLAETGWLEANSNKIDAEIDILLARSLWNKSLGTLTINENN